MHRKANLMVLQRMGIRNTHNLTLYQVLVERNLLLNYVTQTRYENQRKSSIYIYMYIVRFRLTPSHHRHHHPVLLMVGIVSIVRLDIYIYMLLWNVRIWTSCWATLMARWLAGCPLSFRCVSCVCVCLCVWYGFCCCCVVLQCLELCSICPLYTLLKQAAR